MTAKRTILILCDWFLPGYLAGGPIRSVATLTARLGHDLHFRIITTDRDFQAKQAYPNVSADTWTNYQGREVFYISPGNMNPGYLLDLIQRTPHDSIYLNSLFSRLFTVYPLKWKKQGKLHAPLILAPRGMLGDGALAIKPLKKKIFLLTAKAYGLFDAVTWQSTSAQESLEIRKRIGKNAHICEISNLPDKVGAVQDLAKIPGELRLCFISRISEKKNLAFAIDVLMETKDVNVVFDVFGPVEDKSYWEHCQAKTASLPAGIRMTYHGALAPEAIGETLGKYHALFLPTHNENYGHIIVEALQHGRMVLLSDQTPWRNLEATAVGYDLPLADKAAFVNAIAEMAAMDQAVFDWRCRACADYIDKALNTETICCDYKKMFNA